MPTRALRSLRSSAAASAMARSMRTLRRPTASVISGAVRRSGAVMAGNAQRPRSQIQPSSTSMLGSARPVRRLIWPSRSVISRLQPTEQPAQMDGALRTSHGRLTNRYGTEVSAPTGHRSMVLPVKRPSYGSPLNVAISVWSPRSWKVSCESSATS